jgi:hypothetical protein
MFRFFKLKKWKVSLRVCTFYFRIYDSIELSVAFSRFSSFGRVKQVHEGMDYSKAEKHKCQVFALACSTRDILI